MRSTKKLETEHAPRFRSFFADSNSAVSEESDAAVTVNFVTPKRVRSEIQVFRRMDALEPS